VPQITLDSPTDGAVVTDSLPLDGRALDNIALTSLKGAITAVAAVSAAPAAAVKPAQPLLFDLPSKGNFSLAVDLKGLAPGWYDLTIEGKDNAENTAKVTRSILVQDKKVADRVDILFPVNGESLSGSFTLAGRVQSSAQVTEVSYTVDRNAGGTIPVNGSGYFSATVTPDMLPDGAHSIEIQAKLPGDVVLRSEMHGISYTHQGPWIRFTSNIVGDFASSRPFIKGEAGYWLPPVDPADKEAAAQRARQLDAYRIARVEISLDNGRSFTPVSGGEQWQYRLETQNFPDGAIRLMARAVFMDGSEAFDETLLTIDDTPPQVVLLAPREEGRFNGTIPILGTAHDENGIADVSAAVRQGDKTAYEVPAFIQGLYFEGHVLGATTWEAGVGLTFFEDNVKLQMEFGSAPQFVPDDAGVLHEQAFYGTTIGAKLLANVLHMPFSFFLGPDWNFLSMSIAVGAIFSYANNSTNMFEFTAAGSIIGGVVGQIEFPIIKNSAWAMLNTYSIYSEFQLGFITSDVLFRFNPNFAFGLRVGLF
jgi:hypothetical protein